MKYLVIGNQVTPVMEQKAQAGFLKRTKDWVKTGLKDGTLECFYSFPTGGGFFIISADSHEDLMEKLTDCPIGPISEFEVQPICDFGKATDITLRKLKNLGLI